ncbi:stalk domain-containing protein [Paenibacillus daejeonensis]|uniref:stalk domain-containing protein n=1 Tax=Paenibacillus daejeonensis TaxID=135193 RepID=UPI00036A7475|nr:stalk domain-containing protein [Paenibacillus daejeonensis]
MKKKILFSVVVLLAFLGGVVSASSTWGTYRGFDIVKVFINEKPAVISDSPAINFNNRTYVPLYLLNQMGINIEWDNHTKSVNIQGRSAAPTPPSPVVPVVPVSPVTTSYPSLYSNDGKVYLGKLTTNEFDSESIYNQFGKYGSQYQSLSIWNEFGKYGSNYSSESAFNDLASKPPKIIENGKFVAYLTTNTTIRDRISPYDLYALLLEIGY